MWQMCKSNCDRISNDLFIIEICFLFSEYNPNAFEYFFLFLDLLIMKFDTSFTREISSCGVLLDITVNR